MCYATCYEGKHATMKWQGRKCQWKNCLACPECGESQEKPKEKTRSALVGEHKDIAQSGHKKENERLDHFKPARKATLVKHAKKAPSAEHANKAPPAKHAKKASQE